MSRPVVFVTTAAVVTRGFIELRPRFFPFDDTILIYGISSAIEIAIGVDFWNCELIFYLLY